MAKPVVFITGGGRRIGAAISAMLMNEGYYVLIHVRNSVEAQSIIDAYSANDGEISGDIIRRTTKRRYLGISCNNPEPSESD